MVSKGIIPLLASKLEKKDILTKNILGKLVILYEKRVHVRSVYTYTILCEPLYILQFL